MVEAEQGPLRPVVRRARRPPCGRGARQPQAAAGPPLQAVQLLLECVVAPKIEAGHMLLHAAHLAYRRSSNVMNMPARLLPGAPLHAMPLPLERMVSPKVKAGHVLLRAAASRF